MTVIPLVGLFMRTTATAPELIQKLTEAEVRRAKPLRSPWKISDGGGLYLLVAPKGGRYWRYNYRFGGKQKTLALETYPDVSLEHARTRHRQARRLLAARIDPSLRKRELKMGLRRIVEHT